ncbi:MAG: hypothetical protein OXU96_09155 [Gammaproteobacteria bacterium]|nr:hypothetical protein [Gammaproteobacteria bacterium]
MIRPPPLKKQHIHQAIDSIDFVGPAKVMDVETTLDSARKNCPGEWARSHLHGHSPDANLVLLSESESRAPFAVPEALVSGASRATN